MRTILLSITFPMFFVFFLLRNTAAVTPSSLCFTKYFSYACLWQADLGWSHPHQTQTCSDSGMKSLFWPPPSPRTTFVCYKTVLSVPLADLTAATCCHSLYFVYPTAVAMKQYYLSALHLAHNHLDIHILWYDSPQRPVGERTRCINIKHSRGALHWSLMGESGSVNGGRLILDICWWTVIYKGENSVQVCTPAFKNVISVRPTPFWAFVYFQYVTCMRRWTTWHHMQQSVHGSK